MKEVIIRSEKKADIKAIERVTVNAFLSAEYSDQNEHLIVQKLRESDALPISLVAEQNGQVIGHVAVSAVTIIPQVNDWYGLGPISVLPECQGLGIGSMLMRVAINKLEERNAEGCVLLGEPSFYSKFGFKADPNLKLDGVPAEYFLTLPLKQITPEGTVTYHQAFSG